MKLATLNVAVAQRDIAARQVETCPRSEKLTYVVWNDDYRCRFALSNPAMAEFRREATPARRNSTTSLAGTKGRRSAAFLLAGRPTTRRKQPFGDRGRFRRP